MAQGWGDEFREQGRGIVGALLVVGTTYLYTMETWWWGWTLPIWHLSIYAFVGLGIVLAITRNVGFRDDGNGDDETVEADCEQPPPELTFEHVPAGGRERGTLVCPPGTTDPNVSVSSWEPA